MPRGLRTSHTAKAFGFLCPSLGDERLVEGVDGTQRREERQWAGGCPRWRLNARLNASSDW